MEAQIYPVVVELDREGTGFNRQFFYNTPNRLPDRMVVPGGEGCHVAGDRRGGFPARASPRSGHG